MRIKLFLLIDAETVERCLTGLNSFQLNCTARYENGQLNISSHEDGIEYESEKTRQFVLSTEYEDPQATL